MTNPKRERKQRPRTHERIAPYVFLAALVAVSYANTLTADFVYDDHIVLVENVPLRDLRNIPRFFTDPAHTSASSILEEIYRPVRATVFAIEYRLWGLNPAAFHATNLVFHILNSFLIFLFLKRLSATAAPAFAASLLFAAHPALTENVSWICSRSDLLCMFFYLLALLSYLEGRQRAGRGKTVFFGLSASGAFLAMLSKEMGVTFPLAILTIDLWKDGLRPSLRRWAEYLPFIAFTGIYMIIRTSVVSQFAQKEPWGSTPFATAGIMARGFTYYIRLLVFPFNLTVFPYVEPRLPLTHPETLVAISLVLALIGGAVSGRRMFPLASLGVTLFFILLLPASNIVPIKAVVGDRFIYVPSLGFFIIAAAFFRRLYTPSRAKPVAGILFAGGVTAIVFILAVNTVVRNVAWKDNFSLFYEAAETSPNYPRARTALGWVYVQQGDIEEARREAAAALRVDPAYKDAHLLLGAIYYKEGLWNLAERELKTVLAIDPKDSQAKNTLGLVYESQGKLDEALEMFESALENNPTVSEFLNNVGVVLLKKKDFAPAADYFRRAYKASSDNLDAARNLAYALTKTGKFGEAVGLLLEILAQIPGDVESLILLGHAYTESGQHELAIRTYQQALTKDPLNNRSSRSLANLYIDIGQYEKAAALCRNILTRYPASTDHHVLLARALEKLGHLDAALTQLRIAAKLRPADQGIQSSLARLQADVNNQPKDPGSGSREKAHP